MGIYAVDSASGVFTSGLTLDLSNHYNMFQSNPNPGKQTLLSLPREIRDLIYPYIAQEANLYFQDPANKLILGQFWVLGLHIPRSPIVSILLTHSRLREEYLESAIFKELSVSLHLKPVVWEFVHGLREQLPAQYRYHAKHHEGQFLDGNTLSRATRYLEYSRTISILIEEWAYGLCSFGEPWLRLQPMYEDLEPLAPRASTLRVGFPFELVEKVMDGPARTFQYLNKLKETPLEPPSSFMGLALRQQLFGQSLSSVAFEEEELVEIHPPLFHVFRCAGFVFQNDVKKALHWDKEELAQPIFMGLTGHVVEGWMHKDDMHTRGHPRIDLQGWVEESEKGSIDWSWSGRAQNAKEEKS
ncbi:hypothetical protein P154DRAFT_574889 [Amniculicola lignicola CBS 123094]|uniref:Uncharacterized protein n=1 Tax=Amniculicola lignicola CBS 123094 TaxID=1392246 RepID=A0A6A5WIN6_9PLEO|nr:hypothetical protein P154DRAFT_574889 [Amniculicola lignicola CBS 123094]